MRKSLITVVILGSIMPVLDMTIVNVALSGLSESFDAPLTTIQWIVTGYSLALAAIIPVTAWAIGRFGSKRVYLSAISLFVLGSALAGIAWSAEALIGFRVLQGLGGGMIVPTGMAIVIRAADPDRLGRTMGLLGIPILIGPLAGPVLGGWLVDDLSWRWMFFINVPVGALVLLLGARFFPAEAAGSTRRLDVPGLLMLSPGLALLLFGLTRVEHSGIGDPGVYGPVVVGAALAAGFVRRALITAEPLLDLRLYVHRPFGVSAATLALFSAGYFGTMMLTPMFYQALRGESALASGLLSAPQALATGITMQLIGRITDKVAPRSLILPGVLLAGAGMLSFTLQAGVDIPYWRLILSLVCVGVGVGMTMMPSMTTATRHLPKSQAAGASTALNINSQLAMSVGTAVVSVLLAAQISSRIPGSGGAVSALADAAPAAAAQQAARLADAFQVAFGCGTALMLAAALPALLHSRRRPVATGGVSADPSASIGPRSASAH